MLAPALTQEWFDECLKRGLSAHKAISKFNAKNCRKDFSKTIPKALRDEEWNAFLIIKNHRDRWKYMGFNVENVAGSLKVVNNPEIIWAGYVFHENTWYAVSTDELMAGKIKATSSIIFPEIEYAQESAEAE